MPTVPAKVFGPDEQRRTMLLPICAPTDELLDLAAMRGWHIRFVITPPLGLRVEALLFEPTRSDPNRFGWHDPARSISLAAAGAVDVTAALEHVPNRLRASQMLADLAQMVVVQRC